MNRALSNVWFIVVLLFAATAGIGYADPSFDQVNWDAGGDTLGWVSGGTATMSSPATGGEGNTGYLNMHFDALGIPAVETDLMQNTDAEFTGNHSQWTDLEVEFSFLGYTASAQSLYFESTFGGASTWSYDFTSAVDSTWETHTISLNDDTGWTQLIGAETFTDALSLVSLMGISVQHFNAPSAFDYGLDNWQYLSSEIPEPGTVAMTLTALLSMMGTLRRKKRGTHPLAEQA